MVCASPGYLATHGEPATPEALGDHVCIAFEGSQAFRNWPFGGGAAPRTVAIKPRFSVNTADAVADAAAAGLGIARLMSYQVANALSERRVTAILRAFEGDATPVHLVHKPQRIQPLKRRAFLDFVAPRLTRALDVIDKATRPEDK